MSPAAQHTPTTEHPFGLPHYCGFLLKDYRTGLEHCFCAHTPVEVLNVPAEQAMHEKEPATTWKIFVK
jgi:hypothetical protein